MSTFWLNGLMMIFLHFAPNVAGASWSVYQIHESKVAHQAAIVKQPIKSSNRLHKK